MKYAFIGLPKGPKYSKPQRVTTAQTEFLKSIQTEYDRVKGCYSYFYTPEFYVYSASQYYFKIGTSVCPGVSYIIVSINNYDKIEQAVGGVYNVSMTEFSGCCASRSYNFKITVGEVAYIQPAFPSTNTEYLTEAQMDTIISPAMRIASLDIFAIRDFIDQKYQQGIRKFVLNLPSSIVGPLQLLIGTDYSDAFFVNTYSTGNDIRSTVPSNWLFTITSNSNYIPEAFVVVKAGAGSNPIVACVSGTGSYYQDVRDECDALGITVYDTAIPAEADDFEEFITNNPTTVVATAMEPAVAIANFNTAVVNAGLQSSLVVYALDVTINPSVLSKYYLLNADVSIKLDENRPENAIYLNPVITSIITLNNQSAIVLTKKPKIWEDLIDTTTISRGSTNFGVEITEV